MSGRIRHKLKSFKLKVNIFLMMMMKKKNSILYFIRIRTRFLEPVEEEETKRFDYKIRD